jgi:diacylglycerol kinase family enzyme
VAVANSRAYGGGMYIAPEAMLDDGMLDVVVCERTSRWRFLTMLPRVFKGTHVELPEVRTFRTRELTLAADRPFVMYADGDPIGTLPVRVSALPGAVAVLAPRAGAAALAAAKGAEAGSDAAATSA